MHINIKFKIWKKLGTLPNIFFYFSNCCCFNFFFPIHLQQLMMIVCLNYSPMKDSCWLIGTDILLQVWSEKLLRSNGTAMLAAINLADYTMFYFAYISTEQAKHLWKSRRPVWVPLIDINIFALISEFLCKRLFFFVLLFYFFIFLFLLLVVWLAGL